MTSEWSPLENFFNSVISSYHFRGDDVLTVGTIRQLDQQAFRYQFSVDSMLKISHAIEETIIDNVDAADVHACFQSMTRLKPQLENYIKISQSVHGLYIYGAYNPDDDLSFTSELENTVFLDATDTALMDFWFVLAYGPESSMTLFAEEEYHTSDGERRFEGFYTAEPDIPYWIIRLVHSIYPMQVPLPFRPDRLSG